MNAYGPSFRYITPNHVVFEHETFYWWYTVNIDLKLDDIIYEERANIFGLTNGAAFDGIGSQIPAVYIQPTEEGQEGLSLEICTFIDGASYCGDLDDNVAADEWFNLRVEQNCWFLEEFWCYIFVLVNGESQFFMWNDDVQTFNDVAGIIGNTYGQDDISAASGKYANFKLDQCEDLDDCLITFSNQDQPTHEDAVNVA